MSLNEWDEDTINNSIQTVYDLLDNVWRAVYARWPELMSDRENRRIIQGSIGYSAMCKYLQYFIDRRGLANANWEKLCAALEGLVSEISVPYENWMPGGFFSQFTSGSGYSYVAKELISCTAS